MHLVRVYEKGTRKEDWSLIMRDQTRSKFLGSRIATGPGTRDVGGGILGRISCLALCFKSLFSPSFPPAPHFPCITEQEHPQSLLL